MSAPTRQDAGAIRGEDRERIASTVEQATSSGQSRWVAWVRPTESVDPLECYARRSEADRFYWARADSQRSFVAWGRADETESTGGRRFQDVEAWSKGIRERIAWIGEARPADAPLFVGGFGFEETPAPGSKWKSFPAARFVLPAAIGEKDAEGSRFILIARVEPGTRPESVEAELLRRSESATESASGWTSTQPVESVLSSSSEQNLALGERGAAPWPMGPEYRVCADREHSVFKAQVGHALEAIDEGAIEKVVLARSLRVDHDGPVEITAFLRRLESLYPTCTFISMRRGNDTFLAATPEALLRVRGEKVSTAALAGSAPRGRTPEEDRTLAKELEESSKERAEHKHVVDAISQALSGRCVEVEVPDSPRLRPLFGIQHLETKITGRLAANASDRPSILSLADALHPTPAVGGAPQAAAGDWLRRFEGLDRGWYAAPFGWLDSEGGGDLSVALRSALIQASVRGEGSERGQASSAWLFAGAGIVRGSEPEQELVETRIKLRALLAPLTEI